MTFGGGRGKLSMSTITKTTKKPVSPVAPITILQPSLTISPNACLALMFVFAVTLPARLVYPSSSSDCDYCSQLPSCYSSWQPSRVDSQLSRLMCRYPATCSSQHQSYVNGWVCSNSAVCLGLGQARHVQAEVVKIWNKIPTRLLVLVQLFRTIQIFLTPLIGRRHTL